MKTLIHVTLKKHKCSIKRHGLLAMTETPTGQFRLYAVEQKRLRWLCDHIMARHECGVADLVIVVIPAHARSDWRLYNRGIWYTDTDVRPIAYYTLPQYIARNPHLALDFPAESAILEK